MGFLVYTIDQYNSMQTMYSKLRVVVKAWLVLLVFKFYIP